MLFKKKELYEYNPETCRFEAIPLSRKDVLIRVAKGLAITVSAFLFALYFYHNSYVPGKSEDLRAEGSELKTRFSESESQIGEVEALLDDVYRRLNNLYLPVIGEPAIPRNHWEGGRGGSERYNRSHPSQIVRAERRMELMRHRLNLLNRHIEIVGRKAWSKSEELSRVPSLLPVSGIFMSGFGVRTHPISGAAKFHEGIDFSCPTGTPVYASADAVVLVAGREGNGYGIQINLDHENGFTTKYAHLSEVRVSPGQKVRRGQLIGLSGSTGQSTGPHLHYEVARNGVKLDPANFYYEDLAPVEFLKMKKASSGQAAMD